LSFYHPPEEKLNEDELIEKEGLLVLAFVVNMQFLILIIIS
jgi:hypothetical protein